MKFGMNIVIERHHSSVNITFLHSVIPCYVGLSYHGMVHPWVLDRGDGLQIWKVAVNVLNTQSWIANMWWSSSLVIWQAA